MTNSRCQKNQSSGRAGKKKNAWIIIYSCLLSVCSTAGHTLDIFLCWAIGQLAYENANQVKIDLKSKLTFLSCHFAGFNTLSRISIPFS